jgi:NAD(P)-dependent dehydrogenase (short-subunit alcohol dehydrogenase family)
VVTGGGQGVGAAIVSRLLEDDFVVSLDLSPGLRMRSVAPNRT